MRTHPIVLGTAGHIDHGKTALVKALTGIDTDRLKVEKERGITTELGFAHLDLQGRRFGFVDVPGHERFIKAMVAGAGGLDLACLVIAADEGIMPQTREHLDICGLLGVRRGVVALTKVDLVDDDWLELVTEDVRAGLAGSFLEDARIIPVSARTGAGLDALRDEFVRLTRRLETRDASGMFRLPLDRVFTIRGFGTVVTGTVLGGTVRVGDTLIAHPRGAVAKVRGIEVHGESVDESRAGMRSALNLSGVAREDLARGEILCHENAITPSHIIDARFRYLPTSKAMLTRRTRVLFHHATAQLMATLVLVDRDRLAPGDEALVQVRLDITEPIAALPGDRFIARGFVIQEHYGTTIGGGEILRVQAPKARRSAADVARTLERMASAERAERVALEIRSASYTGMDRAELARRLGLAHAKLAKILARLTESGEVVRTSASKASSSLDDALYCHAEPFAQLEKRALEHVQAFHEEHPEREGMGKRELAGRLPRSVSVRLFETLLAALVRRGALEVTAELVRKPRAGAGARTEPSPLEQRLAEQFRAWGLSPERPKSVPAVIGEPEKSVQAALARLLDRKVLVRVKSDLYVDAAAIDALRARLIAHLDQHGQITPTEWKTITGLSRKFSIPLAEYFDTEALTLRVGEIRRRR